MIELPTITFRWTALRPLLMNNGLLADPQYKWTKLIKEITVKGSRKITDEDRARMERYEWMGGVYWSETLGRIAIPRDNILACLIEGATKMRMKRQFTAGIVLDADEIPLEFRDSEKPIEALYAMPGYALRKGVKIKEARVMRVRPMIPPKWSVDCKFTYDPDIGETKMIEAARLAGSICGLGDWRPKFGTFAVEVLESTKCVRLDEENAANE